MPDTVLVVDDDSDLRSAVATTLSEAGYDVREAPSGNAAIAALSTEQQPALILLDLMMPNGNGWDVLERLRARVREQRPNVIVMSAYASSAPKGATALLRKPILREQLLSAVGTYLRAA